MTHEYALNSNLAKNMGKTFRILPPAIALIAVLTSSRGIAQSTDTVQVRASKVCLNCISLSSVTELELPDSLGAFVSPAMFARSGQGDYVVLDPFGKVGLHVFGSNGQYLRTVGRRGGGPGEFTTIESFAIDAFDTLRVFGSNHSVFLLNGRHVRSRRIERNVRPTRVAGLTDSRMVLLGMSGSPDLFGIPIHVVRPDGTIERSFGAEAGAAVGRSMWDRRLNVATDNNANIFTAFANRYAIEQWAANGNKTRVLQRTVNWFPTWKDWDGRSDSQRPPARLAHMFVDDRGNLWTVSLVADAGWTQTSATSRAAAM